jgi:hypothetical protein
MWGTQLVSLDGNFVKIFILSFIKVEHVFLKDKKATIKPLTFPQSKLRFLENLFTTG